MYPGYWDDYMNDGTDGTPTKDCIRNRYQVWLDGKLLLEGQHSRKQILKRNHGFTHGQTKRFNNNEELRQLGYVVKKRSWNVTKNKWEGVQWIQL